MNVGATTPPVSVCIPTYNSARYLEQAIRSVLVQDYEDFELVVCDNASTDDTPELCRSVDDGRFRYLRFEEKVGQGANWNRCLKASVGPLVALLHADDYYYPGFLRARVGTLTQDPSLGFAFGPVDQVHADGTKFGEWTHGPREARYEAPGFFPHLLAQCVVAPPSLVLRRTCFDAVGVFDETRLFGIDWEMWLRIAARFAIAYSPGLLAAYRYHDLSGTTTGIAQGLNINDDWQVLREVRRWIDARPELRVYERQFQDAIKSYATRTYNVAGDNCLAGRRGVAGRGLAAALARRPALALKLGTAGLVAGILIHPAIFRRYWALRYGSPR